ncbi:cupin domain-containing protein [candidate division WOR-3 bacterium]|nr:cupin domain-containing protein [candidate division WOR-3 bacterium]
MFEEKLFVDGIEMDVVPRNNWIPSPKFKGVKMINVLTGKDTNDLMSFHIVEIEPGHEIGDHIHEGKTELHEILEGNGTAEVNGKEIEYSPGVVSFILADTNHKILAGDKGLVLSAKFTPALC